MTPVYWLAGLLVVSMGLNLWLLITSVQDSMERRKISSLVADIRELISKTKEEYSNESSTGK